MPTSKPCDCCPKRATTMMKDDRGHEHRACEDHRKYLVGWVADANHESACDSAASLRLERDYQ